MTALALPASAFAGESNNNGSGGGTPGISTGGDETVGTLPVLGGRQIAMPLVRGWRGDRPAFYIEGSAADLSEILVGARGRGFVTVEVLDLHTQRLRVAFHGDATVVLDRQLTVDLPILTGLAVPSNFGPARATVAWGGRDTRSLTLRPGFLPLALNSMSASGSLDQNPLRILAAGRRGRSTSATVWASPSTLVIRQAD